MAPPDGTHRRLCKAKFQRVAAETRFAGLRCVSPEEDQIIDKGIEEILIFDPFTCEKIDKTADFSFIHALCAPLYCADNSRPTIDPEILFWMLFIGYLYEIKPEARLEEKVSYNRAYKWFSFAICANNAFPFRYNNTPPIAV